MINKEYIDVYEYALAQLSRAGFDIVHRFPSGEPMLIGGADLVARRDKYLIQCDIKSKSFCIQITQEGSINWTQPRVVEFKKYSDDLLDRILESLE